MDSEFPVTEEQVELARAVRACERQMHADLAAREERRSVENSEQSPYSYGSY